MRLRLGIGLALPLLLLYAQESPIGRALVGRKKNDEVTAETPSGPERLLVLDVA